MMQLKNIGGIGMKTSNEAKQMIKKFEGCVLNTYKDVGGYYTIGYGHLTNDLNYQHITQKQANELFESDIKIVEEAVNRYMPTYNFNQNQYDALVSFTFNCGSGNLNKLVANGQRTIKQISEKIPEYNKSNGKIIKGLVTRRLKEKKLFDTQVKSKNGSVFKLSKICLNISKRKALSDVTSTFLLDFTFDGYILCDNFLFYGTGNLDICDGVVCELCFIERKKTGRVELCYIPCDNLRC